MTTNAKWCAVTVVVLVVIVIALSATEEGPKEPKTTVRASIRRAAPAPQPLRVATISAAIETSSELARQSFREELGTLYEKLPTHVREDRVDDHLARPTALFAVTARFGEIRHQLQQRPEMASDALAFFAACARTDATVFSLRAVCLRNAIDLSTAHRLPAPDFANDALREVAELAGQLPPIPF